MNPIQGFWLRNGDRTAIDHSRAKSKQCLHDMWLTSVFPILAMLREDYYELHTTLGYTE